MLPITRTASRTFATTLSSAAIALLAVSAMAPATATDSTTPPVAEHSRTVPNNTAIKLADGVLLATTPNPVLDAQGNPEGFVTVAESAFAGVTVHHFNSSLVAGDRDVVAIDASAAQSELSKHEGAHIVGTWASSDLTVLTVDQQGTVQTLKEGSATVTFTPIIVKDGVATPGSTVFATELTVHAPATDPSTTPPTEPSDSPSPESTEPSTEASEPAPTATPVEAVNTPAPTVPAVTDETEISTQPTSTSAPSVQPSSEVSTEATGEANATATDQSLETKAQPAPTEESTAFEYKNCTEVHNELGHPILKGERGFSPKLDRDEDGIGCEQDTNDDDAATLHTGNGNNGGTNANDSSQSVSLNSTQTSTGVSASGQANLSHTGFGALSVFGGGMVLLSAGTATVIVSRRRTAE